MSKKYNDDTLEEIVYLPLSDLVRLLGSAVVAVESGEGDLAADKTTYQAISDIDARSSFRVYKSELANVMFLIEQALLNQRGDWKLIKDYEQYKQVITRVAEINSDSFEYDSAFKEYRLKD